jgi:hypothetical protein
MLDEFLENGKTARANGSVYDLTDHGRAEKTLQIPAMPGTRVAFVLDLASSMYYRKPIPNGSVGTVVLVRTASFGDKTSIDDNVFIRWDNGGFGMYHKDHLQVVRAKNAFKAIEFAPSDLSGWLRVAGTDSDLIHKATKDLWSCSQSPGGELVISRLFDETGNPLKV